MNANAKKDQKKTELDDGPDRNVLRVESPTHKDERPSCKFGRQCLRRNPRHQLEMAHPGDEDYIVPDMPVPNEDATKCKFGRNCYRLNPEHFKNFTHPRNINIQQNYRKYCIQVQDRRNSDSSDYNVSDDPFAGDSGGSDYVPSDED